MNNAPADPLSWYYDIPVVTRVYLTAAFVTTVSDIARRSGRKKQREHPAVLLTAVQQTAVVTAG